MKKPINNFALLSLILISLCFQSCELFNFEKEETIMDNCNNITLDTEILRIEYSDYQDLGPTINCNYSMQVDFYNGFESTRNSPNGSGQNEIGTRIAVKLRTFENTISPGTYNFSNNDIAETIESILTYSTVNSNFIILKATSGHVTVSVNNGLQHYAINAIMTDGSSLEVCYQSAFIPFVNGYFGVCAPSEIVTYSDEPINLTKGFWRKGELTSAGKQVFTIVLCSEGIDFNFDTQELEGTGDIVIFSVFSVDSEISESYTYRFNATNPFSPNRGILNNVGVFLNYNIDSQSGQASSNPLNDGDQLQLSKTCDRFYVRFQDVANFTGDGRCFTGDLIDIN